MIGELCALHVLEWILLLFLGAGWLLFPFLMWMRRKNYVLRDQLHQLQLEKLSYETQWQCVMATKSHFSDLFKGLSLEAIDLLRQKSDGDYLKREESLMQVLHPLHQNLQKLEEKLHKIEKERHGEGVALKQQIQMMITSEKELRHETENLNRSLRKSSVRGLWGELQLKRILELSGLMKDCHFVEQRKEINEDGSFRPDVVVYLPHDGKVIIDAKVPFEAFLEANSAKDPDVQEKKFKEHVRQLKAHVQKLSKKNYWEQFQCTPEFVILFLPMEGLLSCALEYDPILLEFSAQLDVIIATPTILIGVLKSIACCWKQEALSVHTKEIGQLVGDLYKRLLDMVKPFQKLGCSLSSSVESYNKTIESFEMKVLGTLSHFEELGISSHKNQLKDIEKIQKKPRNVTIS